MLNLQTIHKPTTLAEALTRLEEPETAILAGGTALLSEKRADVRELVDLSALELAYVTPRADGLALGAMTTLAALVEASALREVANGVVARAAHATHANLLRNQATLGGTLISEPAGVLAVTLSALSARVTLARRQDNQVSTDSISLDDFFAQRQARLQGAILTEVSIPAAALSRRAALETVARTPRDKAIVAVCAALELERGIVRGCGIVVGGVAETAWRARDAERVLLHQGLTADLIAQAAMAATSGINPPSDFRGSAQYRSEMVRVLAARALGVQGAGG